MKKLILILIVLLAACSKEEPIQEYQLFVSITPFESGVVNPTFEYSNPMTTTKMFVEGSIVTLTPIPNEGYVFKNWAVHARGNEVPLKVEMTTNKTIIAEFIKL